MQIPWSPTLITDPPKRPANCLKSTSKPSLYMKQSPLSALKKITTWLFIKEFRLVDLKQRPDADVKAIKAFLKLLSTDLAGEFPTPQRKTTAVTLGTLLFWNSSDLVHL